MDCIVRSSFFFLQVPSVYGECAVVHVLQMFS